MWVLKFKAIHKGCRYSEKAAATNCVLYSYPLGYFTKKDKIYFSSVTLIEGNLPKFVSLLKKDKHFKEIEIVGNLVFTVIEETKKVGFYDPFYDHCLFFPKPLIVKPDGYEYWEIASWKKDFLMRLIKILQNKQYVTDYKLFKLKKEKLSDFIFPKIVPKLTDKQKQAITYAFKEGYYDFPKNTKLETLSAKMRISKQAFQKLLAKAEKKIMPFVLK